MQVNQRCAALINRHRHHWHDLRVQEIQLSNQTKVLDFGCQHAGSLAGGVLLAEICLSDLGRVQLVPSSETQIRLPFVQVTTDQPLAACMASQYAGWPVQSGDYYAMGSGPARVLRGLEPVLTQYALVEGSDQAVLVLESSQLPSTEVAEAVASACQIRGDQLTICIARTASLPGTIQIVARSIETTLHKLFELKFPLDTIRSAWGSAPMPPLARKDLQSIGWTNDAILYGAQVNLWVDCDDATIESILAQLPSSASPDFGRPFAEIFASYEYDFYRVDKGLFSPASVVLNNLRTGRLFHCGSRHTEILVRSFGL